MNKVFKIIWSKERNCYVVTSELAKRCTKSPKSNIINRTVVAGVLACVLSFGTVVPVFAEGNVVVGDDARAGYAYNGHPDYSDITVVGSDVNAWGQGNVVVGMSWDDSNMDGYDTGSSNIARTMANGTFNTVVGGLSVALGDHNDVFGSQAAIGYSSFDAWNTSGDTFNGQRTGNFNITQAVALGSYSVATESNTVSVGNSSLKRKIVNMAAGTSANDGATVGQIQTVTAGTNVSINTTINANGSTNKQIVVNGTGTVTKNNIGLINGDTAYKELRPTDNGNYVQLI